MVTIAPVATVLNLSFMWSSPLDDARVFAATSRIMDGSIQLAKSQNLFHRFIYQNYASEGQDIFGGYGEESRETLIAVSRKWDPRGVFERLEPGYFKLGV